MESLNMEPSKPEGITSTSRAKNDENMISYLDLLLLRRYEKSGAHENEQRNKDMHKIKKHIQNSDDVAIVSPCEEMKVGGKLSVFESFCFHVHSSF